MPLAIRPSKPPLNRPPAQQAASAGAQSKRNRLSCSFVLLALAIILCCMGCGSTAYVSPESRPVAQKETLAQLGYSVQVGAFANQDNAVRLSETLERYGLDAYYFVHETGLYKVRFGDFSTKEAASRKAEHARAAGIIDEYWIVNPADYAVRKQRKYGGDIDLRSEIVGTAKRFIGTPYRWGGTSPDEGFDCSGLTMVVYQLNGLKLPRSSRQQYRAGIPIGRNDLLRGDLVFFATSGGRRISHVGIYVGKGRFIHAPGRGKKIRTSLLKRRYYRTRYVGARTYLR
ncbi:MAG: NlpC/P60 family protein [Syntrophobacterales bacterium]